MKTCSIEGCNDKHVSNGYCRSHYYRYKRYGDPLILKQVQSKGIKKNCLIEGCKDKHQAKGYCKKHYNKLTKYGNPLHERATTCSIDGCEKSIEAKSYCQMHYRRFRLYGDPSKVQKMINTPCKIKGCQNTNRRYGYCEEHFLKSNLGKELHKQYSAKRRSLKLNAIINDFTTKDWNKTLKHFENKCAYCGCSDGELHQEHVTPLSRGGANTIRNIIPSCVKCNLNKRAKTLEEWYPKQPFYSREREEKILKWMGYQINENKVQMQLF